MERRPLHLRGYVRYGDAPSIASGKSPGTSAKQVYFDHGIASATSGGLIIHTIHQQLSSHELGLLGYLHGHVYSEEGGLRLAWQIRLPATLKQA